MVNVSYIPPSVINIIHRHIEAAVKKCISGYASAYEKEDTLTGYLFGALQIKDQEVMVVGEDHDGLWKWGIDFKTFGGGGKGSSESVLGADGIIELTLEDRGSVTKKSLLFQAKVDWNGQDGRLYTQCQKLMTWWGAAVVVNYTETGFMTYGVESVFSKNGRRPNKGTPLEELLGVDFLKCRIGDSDLEYNAVKKALIWQDRNYNTVYARFNINRRLKINIQAPKHARFSNFEYIKEIKPSELQAHLLNSRPYNPEIKYADQKKLDGMIKEYSIIFHPDKHRALPPPQVIFYNDIMVDLNMQFTKRKDELKQKQVKKKVEPGKDPELLE